VDEIIFNGVGRPHDLGCFEPGDRPDKLQLDFIRERVACPAGIDLLRFEPLGFEDDLVELPVRKLHHLVFQRRAVPGGNTGNGAIVERRQVNMAANQLMSAVMSLADKTRNLRQYDAVGAQGEWSRFGVAFLFAELVEIDAAPANACGRPGLHPAQGKTQILQLVCQLIGRKFAGPAGRNSCSPDMDQTVQEGSRCQDHGRCLEADPELIDNPRHPSVFNHQGFRQRLLQLEPFLNLQAMLHEVAIAHLVILGARTPHGRSFLGVKPAKLDRGPIRYPSHLSPQGIDLLDEMALPDSPDGRGAGHVGYGIQVDGKEQSAAAHPGSGEGCFTAGMSRPHHNDVILHGHLLDPPAIWRSFGRPCRSAKANAKKSSQIPVSGLCRNGMQW